MSLAGRGRSVAVEVEPRGAVKPWLAALAVGLAGLGIGVAMVGASRSLPWLEHWAGPALTVAGALLWVVVRWRAKGGT